MARPFAALLDHGAPPDALTERFVAIREQDQLFWINALMPVFPAEQDERHTFE